MGACECSQSRKNNNKKKTKIENERNIYNQKVLTGKPNPISIENEEKINKQMKMLICNISINNKFGTGFLCSIPFPNKFNLIPVLITNKSIINQEELQRLKKIDFTLNNDREEKTIYITSERKIYSSKKYDITFIEINPKIDDIDDFLEINISSIKSQQSIYVLQYKNENKCIKSNGVINKINGTNITHNCSNFSGGPILLSDDLKLIGINIRNGQGILLEEPINEFYYYITNKNENNKITMNCIDCYYIIENREEFNLLNDYNENMDDFIYKEEYNESKNKKNFLENSINIYVDSQPINFAYKYKTNNNKIHVKFIFKEILNDLSFLFYDCENLESIDLTLYDTTHIKNMLCMLTGCKNLKTVDLSSLKTNNDINMDFLFGECSLLKSVNFPKYHRINVTNLAITFVNCSSLESIDLSSLNTIKVKDINNLFHGCSNLKSINLSNFKTDNVVNMNRIFNLCHNLQSLDLSNFKTGNVETMTQLFFDCRSLISLDLSSFNTYNVKRMDSMFMGCHSLKSINLSSFNTTTVVDMSCMFAGCEALHSINLSSFNTINVLSMNSMFFGCISLKSIDLSSFITPNLKNIDLMFNGCKQVELLDLSLFNTTNVNRNNHIPLFQSINANFSSKFPKLDNIFIGCYNLKSIKCKDKYILDMFYEVKQYEDKYKEYI